MSVDEQKVRELLERITPYPPGRVSVADIERRLTVRRPYYRMPSPRWMPLLAAAVVAVIALAAVLIARSTSSNRPAHHPIPKLSLELGPWRATMLQPGQFGFQLASLGSSLLTTRDGRLLSIVPGQGIQASAALPPHEAATFAFDGRDVWLAAFRPGKAVVLQQYSAPSLTLKQSVELPLIAASPNTAPFAVPVVLVGAPGQVLVGSGHHVVTVSTNDLSTLGDLTLGAAVAALAWNPDHSHLYAHVEYPNRSRVEDYARTGTAAYTLNRTLPSSGATVPGQLAESNGGLWELGGFRNHSVAFASFDDPAHPAPVVPAQRDGDTTITLDSGTAWIGGSSLACANADTGQLRGKIQQVVDRRAGSTSFIANIVSVGGRLYASYFQDDRKTATVRTEIVQLRPPPSCTG